jgi:hypothetical protein
MIAKETRWLWPLADVEEEEVGVWAMTAMGEIFASRFSNFDWLVLLGESASPQFLRAKIRNPSRFGFT